MSYKKKLVVSTRLKLALVAFCVAITISLVCAIVFYTIYDTNSAKQKFTPDEYKLDILHSYIPMQCSNQYLMQLPEKVCKQINMSLPTDGKPISFCISIDGVNYEFILNKGDRTNKYYSIVTVNNQTKCDCFSNITGFIAPEKGIVPQFSLTQWPLLRKNELTGKLWLVLSHKPKRKPTCGELNHAEEI